MEIQEKSDFKVKRKKIVGETKKIFKYTRFLNVAKIYRKHQTFK